MTMSLDTIETIMAFCGVGVGILSIICLTVLAIKLEKDEVPIKTPEQPINHDIIKEAEMIIDDHLQREALRRYNK